MKFQEIIDNIDVWYNWINQYKKYVPKFIEEAKTKVNYSDWDSDVFNEFFEKNRDQCVSSLQQGYYTYNEKQQIKENWLEIAPHLKKIAENQDFLDLETYDSIKKWLRKFTTQNRKASANRLIASLQPNLLCTIVNEDRLIVLMHKINNISNTPVFTITNNWFKNSNAVSQYFKENIPHENVMDLITYPWQTYDYFINEKSLITDNDMSEENNYNNEINLLEYKKQIILQGPPGTGKTREAKLIAKEILKLETTDKLKDNEQFKLIQFHPSYTYEDFVRGIVAESKGDKIEYKNVNKILGEFAKIAKENFDNHHKELKDYSKEVQAKEYFEKFIEYVQDLIEEKNGYFELTENVGLISTDDEEAFRYKGKNEGWLKNGNRMLYKDILRAFLDNNTERQDVKNNNNISGLARQHASYFVRVLNLFQNFLNEHQYTFSEVNIDKEPLKKYILIIDEINRANLSSVLGELIYALEYRGEEVESMYEVDGSQKLILPPNLYIIGTMNTADRSVGHIDYAIRRRFAFVELLPEKLEDNDEIFFNTTDFVEVAKLFIKVGQNDEIDFEKAEDSEFLSDDFSAKDVALGHSYFIADKKKILEDNKQEYFNMKMKYEVIPILNEYLKDGVFNESATTKIKEIEQRFA